MSTEGFRRIANASEVEQREIRLLKADGILPFTPTTPLSPLSPGSLHPARLLSALRSLPLTRWFGTTPAVPDAASLPALAVAAAADTPGVSRDRGVCHEVGGREGSRRGRRGEGRGGTVADEVWTRSGRGEGASRRGRGADARVYCADRSAAGYPDVGGPTSRRDSSSVKSCASAPAAMSVVLRTDVAMEEGREEVSIGFTTPVRNCVDGGGRGGEFPTPLNGDGYTPDGEDGSEPPDGFTTPFGEDSFRTPV